MKIYFKFTFSEICCENNCDSMNSNKNKLKLLSSVASHVLYSVMLEIFATFLALNVQKFPPPMVFSFHLHAY